MRGEFIRFQNYKNRVALRFRVRCVSALTRTYSIFARRENFVFTLNMAQRP